MNKEVFFIGGSPCSGKSTIAERISREWDAYYFNVDDFLDKYMQLAASKGYPACKKCVAMTSEETWMRDTGLQCREEFAIYKEIAEFVFDDLAAIDSDRIIAEGAAFTPEVMKRVGWKNYIAIVPEPGFQISHYKEREWISYVLEGCSDKKQAFDNWMERDILFAEQVRADCEANGVVCIINDGTRTENEMYRVVCEHFGFGKVI